VPRRSDTRNRIVQVAADAFRDRGYHAVGIARILREAGAHSGSLYHSFAGKEALLSAVIERHRADLETDRIAPIESTVADPVGRVVALVESYRDDLERSGLRHGCPVGDLAAELAGRGGSAGKALAGFETAWIAHVERWLRSAPGSRPAPGDRGALAALARATVIGAAVHARAAGSLAPFDAAVRALRRALGGDGPASPD